MPQDHRAWGIWGGGSRTESGHWACLRHEDIAQGRHVGERTGEVLEHW